MLRHCLPVLSLRERRVAVIAVVAVARADSSSFSSQVMSHTRGSAAVVIFAIIPCLCLLACCSLVATGRSTNTRRHRLPVLSLRERRVAVVAVVCVARADSCSFTERK